MSRSNRRRYAARRQRAVSAPAAAAVGGRRWQALLVALLGVSVVLSGVIGFAAGGQAERQALPADVMARLAENRIAYRAASEEAAREVDSVDLDEIARKSAETMNTDSWPIDTYVVELRTDANYGDGPKGWFTAVGFRFEGPVAVDGIEFDEVVMFSARLGDDGWQPLVGIGLGEPRPMPTAPAASESPMPSPAEATPTPEPTPEPARETRL